ncbi:hypothetical protein MSG28_001288 [Choristoneura fumiferana]|uniref:Uncharacterized protein n=1 Tax=Choristoneura fumiferana TaxID=7141 RepID=A0ACC0K4J0_CHOFU|nr:hypothetical protein MSG28_001288 [Choristoneura fumiferana]
MLKAASLLKSWTPAVTAVRRHPYPRSFLQFLNNQPQTCVSTIGTGLTCASEHRPSQHVIIGLFTDVGSRYESVHENGMTHFFEHLAFKGTKSKTREQIECRMNACGAKFGCFTNRETAVFYADCLCSEVPAVMEILVESIYYNAFNPAEIEAQKAIVVAEMQHQDSDVNVLLSDYLHASAFQGSPLAQSILGSSMKVYNFTDNALCQFITRNFNPYRTVLVSVGGISHEQLECLANTYMMNVTAAVQCREPDLYRFTGSDVRYRNDSLPVGNIAVAVEGPCFCDFDRLYMDVARSYLGGWDQSQYAKRDHAAPVARRASLGKFCDAYQAFNITYKDTALWGVQFLSRGLDQEDMLYTIQDVWMQMCTMITEGELQRAKRQLKAELLTKTDTCFGAFKDIGRYVLYNCNHRPSLVERLIAIDKVTVDDFKDVCMKFIYDKCPVVVVVGQSEGLPEYTRIRASMYWLRV